MERALQKLEDEDSASAGGGSEDQAMYECAAVENISKYPYEIIRTSNW